MVPKLHLRGIDGGDQNPTYQKSQKGPKSVCGGGGGGRARHISKTREIVGIKEEKILDAAGERMRQ